MSLIKSLYEKLDFAFEEIEKIQKIGGACGSQLMQIDDFLTGQKIKIQRARTYARELMSAEEEKHEKLIEKLQAHKIIEKLKIKQKEQFRKDKNKKINKEVDDLATIRYQSKR